MATGLSNYDSVSALINPIYEGALFTLRAQNLLLQTVATFSGNGMAGRKVTQYGQANPRIVGEGEDVVPTKIERDLLQTLTPRRLADSWLLTDERVATDSQNVVADASLEMGNAFAAKVDTYIASHFGSLAGGTVGSAGGTLTWGNMFDAEAILEADGVPKPYFVVLHPFQFNKLAKELVNNGSGFAPSDQTQDAFLRDITRGFMTPLMDQVVFMRSANIAIDANDDAIGAMYSRLAIAYDERRPFNLRPERDESRESWELNFSLWEADGTWDAARGVQLISDASTPS